MTQATPTSSAPRKPRSNRTRGLVIGAGIGGAIAVLASLSSGGEARGIPIGPGALLAGTLGGWLFGPSAAGARSKKRIALVLVAYAGVATLIGDVVAATEMEFRTMPGGFTIERAVDAVGNSLTLAGFGILIIGPLIFPLALGAAAVWWAILTEGADDHASTGFPPTTESAAHVTSS